MLAFLIIISGPIPKDDSNFLTEEQQANLLLGAMPGFGKSFVLGKL